MFIELESWGGVAPYENGGCAEAFCFCEERLNEWEGGDGGDVVAEWAGGVVGGNGSCELSSEGWLPEGFDEGVECRGCYG